MNHAINQSLRLTALKFKGKTNPSRCKSYTRQRSHMDLCQAKIYHSICRKKVVFAILNDV
ncbi:hypothetical protein Lalb_Chr00c16g0404931 [Lupinus albus]|uniref:Uncharacterized protein n=1 Tax=Lupinus albus TaxID=3870 RepID=A0A6A4NA21_LUPAL|nr:hypothetical protein Lalb_Chr00c16g0404931 [Lupinus albus]